MDVLTLVEKLLAARPFTARGVELLTGARLRLDAANANRYITLYLSDHSNPPRPPLRRVELRLPRPGATRRDGLLILDLDPAAVQLRQPAVTARFGAKFLLEFPTAHQPPAAPLYHIYRHPWGDLRFGFGRAIGASGASGTSGATGLLETVVIDAERE